jgi:signal transduction histidine kinase
LRTSAEILRGLPYFSDLPDGLLARVCDASEQIDIPAGTEIIAEGTDSEEMYVVVDGQLIVTKRSGGKDVELGRIGPGEVVGEIALLDQAPRTATVSAAIDTHAIKVPVSAFEELLTDSRVVRRMFRTVTSRLRGIEDSLRHEERMAALGKMAAQLMHELNNPAAAVARSTQELARLQTAFEVEAGELARLLGIADMEPPEPPADPLGALERAEAEEEIVGFLEANQVENPWDIAPAMIEQGWSRESLEAGLDGAPPEVRGHLTRWLGLRSAIAQVVDELGIGARRISELVRVVKEYSFLDRAPVLELDITSGIRDTLILLKHKLRNIEVDVLFDPDLNKVEAPGRDLNQVWTNLIDNASDAMADGGSLHISADNEGSEVVVRIRDTGTGIPDDVAQRIFDPFFTTKEPGKGTGLGLHTVHTIMGRIGGSITLSSSDQGTVFEVRLPAVI